MGDGATTPVLESARVSEVPENSRYNSWPNPGHLGPFQLRQGDAAQGQPTEARSGTTRACVRAAVRACGCECARARRRQRAGLWSRGRRQPGYRYQLPSPLLLRSSPANLVGVEFEGRSEPRVPFPLFRLAFAVCVCVCRCLRGNAGRRLHCCTPGVLH